VSGADRNVPKSYAALDRIAREESTVAKLDATKLDACLAKQDETQIRASSKKPKSWACRERRRCLWMASAIDGAVAEEQVWMVIDRARCWLPGSSRRPSRCSHPLRPPHRPTPGGK